MDKEKSKDKLAPEECLISFDSRFDKCMDPYVNHKMRKISYAYSAINPVAELLKYLPKEELHEGAVECVKNLMTTIVYLQRELKIANNAANDSDYSWVSVY